MSENNLNLWRKITSVTEEALATKVLHPMATKYQIVEENDIKFIVRILDNLNKKDKAKKKQKEKQKESKSNFNPFLPYEKDLFIADIEENHVLILNKYNVVNHHLLIITREFESQENILTLEDFTALWIVLKQINGLGFYNGGKIAGASQPHKHLQLVPYPLVDEIDTIPIDDLVLSNKKEDKIINLKSFPYLQAVAFFEDITDKSPEELGKITLDYYYQLLGKLNINIKDNKPLIHYNLLITKSWMMIIPRSKEKMDSISINSLGFAGALLVKNKEELELLLKHKPLEILAKVGLN
ncbi:MAG: phosphorylase [Cyanobacteria bacterium]|nr:phosphorylase [Cyanobacteria bacterium CG_2015-16_32_12]NCO78921.1 phosphorylase [Cyanobacteria bacterium CG_2015-22_32_23]NCQ04759.1 phosphorylase [Cyanobacteria bacterium CG_2015-09_32_10]NCQ40785.1 phosphorylase [Cyanobacteria bacterium CG_2015-04_32_10]NCS83794.1 phosphorylase [Cyanobacteria bacterium CG_2015-02_32_10]